MRKKTNIKKKISNLAKQKNMQEKKYYLPCKEVLLDKKKCLPEMTEND